MNGAFIKIKARTVDFLGIAVLSNSFFKFIGVHICFMIFTNLHGVFINTLLYRITGENTIIMRYNIIFYFCFAISMSFAATIMRKTSPRISSRIGILLYITMYIAFFIMMFTNTLAQGMPIIAVLSAFASSTYWISYNVMLIEFTGESERDVAVSFIGINAGVVSLVMPALSGFVISRFIGMAGYYVMFGVSLLIAIITMVLSATKIPPIPAITKKTYFKVAIKDICKSKIWQLCMVCEFIKGLREGTFAFFLNLLLFDHVQNEALIGLNTLLVGVLSVLANWTIGKFLRPEHRIKWMFTATTVLFIASGLLFFKLDTATIMIMSVVNAYFNVILLNPIVTVFYSLFNRMPHGKEARYELLAIKDTFLCTGRGLGVVMVLVLPQTQLWYIIAMCALTATQYLTVLLTKKTVTNIRNMTAVNSQ